jgi:hypothetical protein
MSENDFRVAGAWRPFVVLFVILALFLFFA